MRPLAVAAFGRVVACVVAAFVLATPSTASGGTLVGGLTELSHDDLVDLTSLGTIDWAVFGLDGDGEDNGVLAPDSRKVGATTTIGGLSTRLGSESLTDGGQFTFAPRFGWSDGAPISTQVASVVDETSDAALMLRNEPVGAGLEFSLPADTGTLSALLYVGAFRASGQLVATLSDGSAAAYSPNAFTHSTGIDRVGVYRIDYAADSPGQTLDVRWEQIADAGNFNMISLSAVALTTPDNLPESPLTTPGLFESGQTLGAAASGGSLSTVAGDLDGDGVPEIVTIASSDSTDPHFRVHKGNASDSWDTFNVRSPGSVQTKLDRFGGDSFLIDLNGDERLDILAPETSNNPDAATLWWYENPASGDLSDFWVQHPIGTWDGSAGAERPAHMAEVFAGDMDGDGDADVVTRDVNNGVHILENDGSGAFTRHFLATNPREGLALFDPDHDGDLDILINGVWFEAPDPGDGSTDFADLSQTGAFTTHVIAPDGAASSPWYPDANTGATQSDYATKVIAVDLNGDEIDDVVITNSEELTNQSDGVKPEGLTVYLADAVGGDDWTEVVVQTEGRKLHTLDAADVDLDGDIDLLTGVSRVGQGDEPAEVFVYLNHGDGAAWTKSPVDDVNIYSGVLVDYDGDGDADVVGPDNWRTGPLRFFESNATTLSAAAPGDFNGDGLVNSLDYDLWTQRYGSVAPTRGGGGDGNADGFVDAADFTLWRDAAAAEAAATIPEPAAWLLAAAGGLGAQRRFRFFFDRSASQTRRA